MSSDNASNVVRVGCREIVAADADQVIAVLAAGFPLRTRSYWDEAFEALRRRDLPVGCPRYGHVLMADGGVVGVILLICTAVPDDAESLRCNLSSWYVDPRFRIYAPLLIKVALAHKGLTYTNTSSVSHTRETVLSQRFTCYADGQLLAVSALGRRVPGLAITAIGSDLEATKGKPDRDMALLVDHARMGCISLLGTIGDEAFPFVFLRRRIPHTIVPCAQLIYCPNITTFQRFQGPLGRYLLARGMPVTMSEANDAEPGTFGRFFRGRAPAFYAGPRRPRLGDLAYNESVLFGP